MTSTQTSTLYYVHDPMCSWCWGFRPAWRSLQQNLPASISLVSLVGGLAPDSDEPMPQGMRDSLQATWRRISEVIPGTRFNFDFWSLNTPRRSTYPACRAALAARVLADKEAEMTEAIQRAYYLDAKNPSDNATLIDAAGDIGLDTQAFAALLQSAALEQQFRDELARVHAIGVNSFPSLVLETATTRSNIPIRYTDPDAMLSEILHLNQTDGGETS